MALVKNQNSYATVAEADAYFADRLDVDAWNTANETQKAQALVTATTILDSMSWSGSAVSVTQPLAFPREGSYFDPRIGSIVELSAQPAQKRLLTGLYEMAYHLLNNDGLTDSTGSVVDLDLEGLSLKSISNPETVPGIVRRLIRPILLNASSRTWWRAN